MEHKINASLNQSFEMIGLLYLCSHPDTMGKEMWDKAAAEHGINCDAIYQKARPVQEKYCSTFQKAMVRKGLADFDFFFSEEDDDFILLLQTVCANHAEWFAGGLGSVTQETISSAFANQLAEDEPEPITVPPSVNEMIKLLETAGLSSTVCWKLMLILQSPKQKLQHLACILQANQAAYEKAIAAVQKPLSRLLHDFPKGSYFSTSIHPRSFLTPVLVYPAGELINPNDGRAYIGLYAKDLYRLLEQAKSSQQNLLPALKAISDGSKFEILRSLMRSPKYNLELAEELHLTAATVSHHMSVLLTLHLVSVEKKDGRVYYTLAKETLQQLITELHSIFSF